MNDPSMEHVRYLIIGAGFGGLGMGIQLKKHDERDFQIWEKAPDLGGCWRDNTYPGAACDVPSHLYSYSFAPKANWSHKFAPQAEIHDYQSECAEQFRLYDHIRFNRTVDRATFDPDTRRWIIIDEQGDTTISAQFLITATGLLSRPAFPNIDGLDSFKGPVFHSARWRHDVDLKDKTIAVIGTGASAIQFVPEIARDAGKIELFQRSAPYVIAKPDRKYTRNERRMYQKFPILLKLSRLKTYLVFESRFVAFTSMRWIMPLMRWRWKRYMFSEVQDEEKRRQLTPDYTMGCKRILISNNYYPTIAQERVEIRDKGIDHINETGIVDQQGNQVDADVIILGTGFTATEFLAPMTITGLDGVTLNQAWKNGAEAYLGVTVNRFPNLFIIYGPNTNLGHNSVLYMLECQFAYILKATLATVKGQYKSIEVKQGVQSRYNEVIQKQVNDSVWSDDCNSWYKTDSGKNTVNWPGFTLKYNSLSKQFSFEDYNFT